MRIEIPNSRPSTSLSIKIIGVGGAGGNAVNNMIESNIKGVEYIVANTDANDLEISKAKTKIQLGPDLCKGLGAGNVPKKGEEAAQESEKVIKEHLRDTHLLILSAGMGKGTGTGASGVIAKIAKAMDILTIAIVTTPFNYEGVEKEKNATYGLKQLYEYADSIIIVENDKISEAYKDFSLFDAFKNTDKILVNAAKSISDIANINGVMNVDFEDVKRVTQGKGFAIIGSGSSKGDDRAVEASNAAINDPLMSHAILDNCKGLLINMTVGDDFMESELRSIVELVTSKTGKNPIIIQGVVRNPDANGEVHVSVIATGLDTKLTPVANFRNSESEDDEVFQPNTITDKFDQQKIKEESKKKKTNFEDYDYSKKDMLPFQRGYMN
ncbi:MAG: cell division protein FtsZ [Candidatus Cloacimonadota bacterium]|nr:cell division protein FtsZ [Candidatus Cloacimonadota bacterium]